MRACVRAMHAACCRCCCPRLRRAARAPPPLGATHMQVALVAGAVAFVLFIGQLGEPIVENTIKSFPTPAEYAAYEERND